MELLDFAPDNISALEIPILVRVRYIATAYAKPLPLQQIIVARKFVVLSCGQDISCHYQSIVSVPKINYKTFF